MKNSKFLYFIYTLLIFSIGCDPEEKKDLPLIDMQSSDQAVKDLAGMMKIDQRLDQTVNDQLMDMNGGNEADQEIQDMLLDRELENLDMMGEMDLGNTDMEMNDMGGELSLEEQLALGNTISDILTDQSSLQYHLSIDVEKSLRLYTNAQDFCANADTIISLYRIDENQQKSLVQQNDDIAEQNLCSMIYALSLTPGQYLIELNTEQIEAFPFELTLEYLNLPIVNVTQACLRYCDFTDVIDCERGCDPNFQNCLREPIAFCSSEDFCNQNTGICDNRPSINDPCHLGLNNECAQGLYCFTPHFGLISPYCAEPPQLNDPCLAIDDRCPDQSFCHLEESGEAFCQPPPQALGDACTARYPCPNEAWVCHGLSSTCQLPICGNFQAEALEECDDGNLNGLDGCNERCMAENRLDIALPGQRINFYSNLTNASLLYSRAELGCQNGQQQAYYQVFEINNQTGSPQRLKFNLYSQQQAMLTLYQASFMPMQSNQGCTNTVLSEVRGGGRDGAWNLKLEEITIQNLGKMFIVISVDQPILQGKNRAVLEVSTLGIESGSVVTIAPPAQSTLIRASLDRGDDQWHRFSTQCEINEFESQNLYYYDYYFIENDSLVPQSLRIQLNFIGGDGFLHLFGATPDVAEQLFDPTLNPCLVGADSIRTDMIPLLTIPPQEKIILVASSFYPEAALGSYELLLQTLGCGDQILSLGESCDDGNVEGGDGCDAQCQIEVICGDGLTRGSEECDDGNLIDLDGCSSLCRAEAYDLNIDQPLVIQGELTGFDNHWTRPYEDCVENAEFDTYRDVYRFTNQSDDFIFIKPQVNWSDDGLLYQYADPFDAENPVTCIQGNDDDQQNYLQSALNEIALAPQQTIVFVLSAFEGKQALNYQFSLSVLKANRIDDCQILSPAQVTSAFSTQIFASVFEASMTESLGFNDHIVVELGYGPENTMPDDINPAWLWQSALFDETQMQSDRDVYKANLLIPQSGLYRYAFRASADQGRTWRYCDLDGSSNGYQLEQAGQASIPGKLVINEVDYDMVGADNAEFIELYNNGNIPISLANTFVVIVNGGTVPPTDLKSVSLSALGQIEPGEYIVVIGNGYMGQALGMNIRTASLGTSSLQNDLEAVRIEKRENNMVMLLDALSYGGNVIGNSEGGGTLLTDSNQLPGALGRCPNGQDTDSNTSDFIFISTVSPGMINICP